MKHIKLFEEFLNESWPFDGKKHISDKEEEELYKYASKHDILNDYDSDSPGTVKDKKFQSSNEEKAWELFEIWASVDRTGKARATDCLLFLSEFTFTPHDDIFDKGKRRSILAKASDIMIDMIRERSTKDLMILKKMKFFI